MSSHKLFKKYFGNQIAVDLKHPNMEKFFDELNEECMQEDKQNFLIDFLLYLNNKGLINNHDFDYEEEAKRYIKVKNLNK